MLHTKLLVMDGRLVAVGSMNLDMRSQLQNTEIAVLIGSRRFSQPGQRQHRRKPARKQLAGGPGPQGKAGLARPQESGLEDSYSEPDASLGLRLMLQAARASGSGQSALDTDCGQAHSCCRSRSGSACTQSLMAR